MPLRGISAAAGYSQTVAAARFKTIGNASGPDTRTMSSNSRDCPNCAGTGYIAVEAGVVRCRWQRDRIAAARLAEPRRL